MESQAKRGSAISIEQFSKRVLAEFHEQYSGVLKPES
jgi:hypothetical protein